MPIFWFWKPLHIIKSTLKQTILWGVWGIACKDSSMHCSLYLGREVGEGTCFLREFRDYTPYFCC
jgi:hypothetical protein